MKMCLCCHVLHTNVNVSKVYGNEEHFLLNMKNYNHHIYEEHFHVPFEYELANPHYFQKVQNTDHKRLLIHLNIHYINLDI